MEQKKLYDLSSSQNVVKLQCKYSLFKRVINILTSAETDEKIDFNIMERAFNWVVTRNDCLRLKFIKSEGKLMQYFEDEIKFENIPILTFSTKDEFEQFYLSIRKKPIAYLKGKVIEPYFINNYNGKSMVFFKVCHLALDAYGINIIFKDLFEVYDALKNHKEFQKAPTGFESVLQKDLQLLKNNNFIEKNEKFYTEFLSSKEMPFYAGIHGKNCKIWQHQLKRNRRAMKMFFINNDTDSHIIHFNQDLLNNAEKFCEENKITLPSLLYLTCSLCASKINNNTQNLMPIELCNCRGTVSEKNTAGIKVQSLGFYTTFDYTKTFYENLEVFNETQSTLYHHIGYPDVSFQMLLHKIYTYGFLETLHPFLYSFIPYYKPNGVEINFYTNGKFALPVYIGFMFNTNDNSIDVAYEYQTKIISKQNIEDFQSNFELILNQIIQNPKIKLSDLKVKE